MFSTFMGLERSTNCQRPDYTGVSGFCQVKIKKVKIKKRIPRYGILWKSLGRRTV